MEKIKLPESYKKTKVKSVSFDYQHTFDIEVEKDHYYILSNGIISHNTISLLAGCSSSIEPIFSPTIFRHDNTGSYEIKHPDSESEWFACALDGDGGPREVKYQEHIQIQAAFQKYCNSGISKTINLPSTATIDDVKNAYKLAWHSGCFAKGNSVYTSLGLKDVSDIKVNDLVYGHDGKLHKVTYAFDLPIEKRSFTKLEICSHEGIEATDEHPILVVLLDKKEDRKKWENRNKQIEWKPISEIKIGDHVLIPKLKEFQETKKDINVSSLISSNYIIEQNRIYPSRPLPWKKDKITICPNSQSIPANVVIDDNFCSFIGWFIAEGHFNDDSYVRLTLNPYEEQHIGDEICKYVKETFGLIGTQEIIHSNNGKSLRLQFASKIFSEFLQSLVGRGSYNKHLPNWFLNIDINKREQILKSYHSGDKGVTMSPQLSKDLFLGWLSIGKTPRFQKNYGEGYEVVDCLTNQTGKPIGEFLAYRVKSISRRISDEKVYNFAVEDVDSYLVNGIASHNCKGITIYRNNSKTTQVLNLTNKIATQPKTAQIDRPPELPCDIYKLRADGIDWHIIIGLKDGNPYELFAVNGGKELPKNGFVVKKKKRHYSLLDTSREVLLENIIEFENKIDSKVGLETRRFSLELRHGIPPKYIVEQIDKSNDVITSFSKAAARIFKKYYLEQNTVSGALCPECAKEGKESKLIYVSGCSKCNTCSYSGCG